MFLLKFKETNLKQFDFSWDKYSQYELCGTRGFSFIIQDILLYLIMRLFLKVFKVSLLR